MSILRQLSEAEQDLADRDQLILQAAEATHHLASMLAATNERYWSLPTERLIAVLNADIPATIATFQANTALALTVNASLDALALPQFPKRAPTEPGRADIVFDGTRFVQVLPEPVEEPEPEPEPAPEQPE